MKLTNYTKFDTELIREIIRFARPPGISNFDISFKNSGNGWKGKAYYAGCSYHDGGRVPLVTIGVPKDRLFNFKTGESRIRNTTEELRYKRPRVRDFGSGYLRSVQYSPVEDMVHLIAHELRHLWQAKNPTGRRAWGARGQFSERDADAYAIQKVRQWRRRGPAEKETKPQRAEQQPSPPVKDFKAAELEKKLAAVAAKLKKWNTKAKRAATAIKKLMRQQKRIQKKLES